MVQYGIVLFTLYAARQVALARNIDAALGIYFFCLMSANIRVLNVDRP